MRRPYLLLAIGLVLSLHWLLLVGAIWYFDLSLPITGCAAFSLLVLCLAVLVVGRVGGWSC